MRPKRMSRKLILTAALISLVACATSSSAAPDAQVKTDAVATLTAPAEPQTVDQAVEAGKKAVEAAKGGLWWYFSALVVLLVMFAAKTIGTKMGWWVKLGRWRYVIVPALSIVASLLAAFQGGVSVAVAVGVLGASLSTGKLQELWEHGIMGKPHGESTR